MTFTTCKTLAEVFLHREEQGQFIQLYGTEHISVASCWMSLITAYAVIIFIVQLQPSFLREICSQWQIVSLIKHFLCLFETTLLRSFQGQFHLHLCQLSVHSSYFLILKTIQIDKEIGVSCHPFMNDCKLAVFMLSANVFSQQTWHSFFFAKTNPFLPFPCFGHFLFI